MITDIFIIGRNEEIEKSFIIHISLVNDLSLQYYDFAYDLV